MIRRLLIAFLIILSLFGTAFSADFKSYPEAIPGNQTISVTAGENLTAGDVVSLINSYGTVTAKKNIIGTISTVPNSAESIFNANTTDYVSGCKIDSARFLVAYKKSDTKIYAKVGTISESGIVFGNETNLENVEIYFITTVLVSTDKILAIYGSPNGSACRVVCLSISNLTINVGAPVSIETSTFLRYPSASQIGTDKALICYQRSSDTIGRAVICTVSNTVPSFGNVVTFNNATTYYVSCSVFDTTSAIVTYQDSGNSSYGTAQVLSINDTDITPGTEYVFKTGATTNTSVATINSTKAVITYEASGGASLVATNSSGTLSYGTAATFTDGQDNSTAKIDETHVIIASQVAATNLGQSMIGTISGTGITLGTAYSYNAAESTYNSVCYLGSNKSAIAYTDVGNSSHGTAVVNTWATSDYSAVRGICQTTTSSGSSAPILISGLATGLSSLVTGSQYFLTADFGMSTAPVSLAIMKNSSTQTGEVYLGTAKSATELYWRPDYK